jgi:hypothetical protein
VEDGIVVGQHFTEDHFRQVGSLVQVAVNLVQLVALVAKGVEAMDVPDKFPPGCEFISSFGGDEYVRFPDGNWFKLEDDDKLGLMPINGFPVSSGYPSSEASFLFCVADAKRRLEDSKAT